MITVYVYILDTLADWELGNLTSELNTRRFFKEDAEKVVVKTVSHSSDVVKSMGGMSILPDCLIEDIIVNEKNVLILPGANTWDDPKHIAIIKKAKEFLTIGGTLCAICGATSALANAGLLDNRPHTSNGQGFLDMVAPNYKGQPFYIDKPAVMDKNLITASSTGSLLWAKLIIEHLNIFSESTLSAWYEYFSTGNAEQFFALIESIPKRNI